ncbi:hypothetical protein CAC42_7953 [Sphaceloma murrayae]|uniref:ubiquitinyl hydrolase 1 n=1 Tax=Sphaceloma murrayae TaxID=2082308 RepID=A0A2K1QY53_9PEZI|nr:hypothetical protein CAC42_7953 [Sphaceloma murrayae]
MGLRKRHAARLARLETRLKMRLAKSIKTALSSPCLHCRQHSLHIYGHQRRMYDVVRRGKVSTNTTKQRAPKKTLDDFQMCNGYHKQTLPESAEKSKVLNDEVKEAKLMPEAARSIRQSHDGANGTIGPAKPSPGSSKSDSFLQTLVPSQKSPLLVDREHLPPAAAKRTVKRTIDSPLSAPSTEHSVTPVAAPDPKRQKRLAAAEKQSQPTPDAKKIKVQKLAREWPSDIGRPRRRGLSNPMSWCYRRSVLQAVFSTPQFYNLLLSHPKGACAPNCVTCALQTALQSYHKNLPQLGNDVKQLDRRIAATGRRSDPRWIFNNQTHEDAHDFFQYLLGTVEGSRCIK